MNRDEQYDRGLDVRREMFGRPGAEGITESTREINDKMQEIVTRWVFGDIWSREGIARKERSMLTVAMLIALGRSHEMVIHMKGALANGVTEQELHEICLHSILYCGIPLANDGMRVLESVLAEVNPDSPLLKSVPLDF